MGVAKRGLQVRVIGRMGCEWHEGVEGLGCCEEMWGCGAVIDLVGWVGEKEGW